LSERVRRFIFFQIKKAKQSEGDGKRKEKGKDEERGHMQTTD
jgi:hypothetical protein